MSATKASVKSSGSSGKACSGSAGQDSGKRWAALDSRLERLASAAERLVDGTGDQASTAA
ncbi:MAG TPA: hypothetical protein VMA95_10850 [Streptosporangiaceae bacterium]|nr:hypothetical protein [Streptosporangiaceae bacterium]